MYVHSRPHECTMQVCSLSQSVISDCALSPLLLPSTPTTLLLSTPPHCPSLPLTTPLSPRPSPKLVLIALQLCRIALPLMTVAECSQVSVPSHPSLSHPTNKTTSGKNLAADIVGLLLAKLAEYIVPDASQVGSILNGDWLAQVDTPCICRCPRSILMRHFPPWRSRL